MLVNEETFRILRDAYLHSSRDFRSSFKMRELKPTSASRTADYKEMATLHAVLGRVRGEDGRALGRDSRLRILSRLSGRPLDSSDDLYFAEVKAFNRLAFLTDRYVEGNLNGDFISLLYTLYLMDEEAAREIG